MEGQFDQIWTISVRQTPPVLQDHVNLSLTKALMFTSAFAFGVTHVFVSITQDLPMQPGWKVVNSENMLFEFVFIHFTSWYKPDMQPGGAS